MAREDLLERPGVAEAGAFEQGNGVGRVVLHEEPHEGIPPGPRETGTGGADIFYPLAPPGVTPTSPGPPRARWPKPRPRATSRATAPPAPPCRSAPSRNAPAAAAPAPALAPRGSRESASPR